MKTDKEYPATHSMSTAWYAIDEDGNVAIIEFDDNGPVPVSVPESAEEEIIFETFADKKDEYIAQWPYNQEEVDNMLADAHDAFGDDKEQDLFTTVVRVDMSRYNEFLELAKTIVDADKDKEFCEEDDYETFRIDRERGLFYVDWCGANDEIDQRIKSAIESKLVVPLKFLNVWQNYDSPVDVLRHYPFFVYRQDYDAFVPLRRTVVPEKAFKEERLPDKAREAAIRLPLKFKDAPLIQIAQYEPSDAYSHELFRRIEGRNYSAFKMPDESVSFIADSSVLSEQCGKTCKECCPRGVEGANSYDLQRCKEPTVVVIKDFMEVPYQIRTSHEYYLSHSVFISILRGLPCGRKVFEKDGREIKSHPTKKYFEKCRTKLEDNISFFRPNAIMIYREVLPFLTEFYPVKDGIIQFGEQQYPYFVWEEREQYLHEIDALAHLPYRGGHIEWVIPLSDEDMKELPEYHIRVEASRGDD